MHCLQIEALFHFGEGSTDQVGSHARQQEMVTCPSSAAASESSKRFHFPVTKSSVELDKATLTKFAFHMRLANQSRATWLSSIGTSSGMDAGSTYPLYTSRWAGWHETTLKSYAWRRLAQRQWREVLLRAQTYISAVKHTQ